jgi:hypothetical protein
MKLIIVSILTFLINLPFGYWRANVKKYSVQWILAIHIAVLIIVIERIFSGIGFALITYPIIIGAFFFGQYFGGKIHRYFFHHCLNKPTSCLVVDACKCLICKTKQN